MEENKGLLKRSRVVLRLSRTRSSRSRSIFACFCLLLLFVGAVRNYTVENAIAERVRLMSYSYTWVQRYVNENGTLRHIPSQNRSAQLSNPTMIELSPKQAYKGVQLPGIPYHTLPSRKPSIDENDSNSTSSNNASNEKNEMNETMIENTSSEESNQSSAQIDVGGMNKNGNESQASENATNMRDEEVQQKSREEMPIERKSDKGHGWETSKMTSARNSTISEHEEEMDESELEKKQTQIENESVKRESNSKVAEVDQYDEEARAGMTRNMTRSDMKPQTSSEAGTMSWTMFKFESCTPESLSQWQNEALLQRKTVDSLRRLESVYITQYIEWHRGVIDEVKGGRVSGDSVRTLVYRGKEGVGDRIRGMVHAFLCAMLTERLLLIDWVEPYPLSVALEIGVDTNFTHDPYYFGTGTELDYKIGRFGKHSTVKDIRLLLNTKEKWLAMTKETRPSMKFLLVDVPFHFPQLKAVKKLGRLKRHPWPTEFFPLVFRVLFQATPALRDCVEEFVAAGNDISRPFIGIHVRLGHDTREGKSKRFKTNMSLEESATCAAQTALEMAKARGISPPRFFLACDTAAFRAALSEAVKDGDPNAVLMYGNWKVKHVRHLNAENDDDYDAFINTFIDLLVLSHADSLLHMRSGFANLARWMGGIEPQFIFHNNNCLQYK